MAEVEIMKRKDVGKDILWFLNKNYPVSAAETDRRERGRERENEAAVSQEQCSSQLFPPGYQYLAHQGENNR